MRTAPGSGGRRPKSTCLKLSLIRILLRGRCRSLRNGRLLTLITRYVQGYAHGCCPYCMAVVFNSNSQRESQESR